MKALSLAVVLALAAAPALAAETPAKAPDSTVTPGSGKPAKPQVKPEDKLICTRESDTGSFLAKRVCKTQAQIDSDRRAAEQMENDRQQLSNRTDVR